VFYVAIKYFGDFENALIANVNLGGDNCNRSIIIGLLLGAVHKSSGIPKHWKTGLHAYTALGQLIPATADFISMTSGKITGRFLSNRKPDLSNLQFSLPVLSNPIQKMSILNCDSCKEGNCNI